MPTLVTVIIPVYNAEKYVEKAVRSILTQTYTNIEVLIADDGSTDNSKNIIDSFTDIRIKRYHNESNIGYLKTCNNLFLKATGEFITFQDADDWSSLNRIEMLIEAFRENDALMLCGSNFIRTDISGSTNLLTSEFPCNYESILNTIAKRKERFPFLGGAVMFKRILLQEFAGYRTFYDRIGCEDIDFIMLISEKHSVLNLPAALYYYRYEPNSVSRAELVKNFKKYYALDIVYFLRHQRTEHSTDAVSPNTNETCKEKFSQFLKSLETKFNNEKLIVYKRLILNCLSNKDFVNARKRYVEFIKQEKAPLQFKVYFYYRYLRSLSKKHLS